ncbi:MAG: sodium:proline symporter [Waddliaceae bacterium]|nr:sodium:proline symporter [Waddliaceae bacterium]
MEPQLLLAFLVYLAILLSIGLLAHKRSTTASDFILGNRSLNFWVTALSAHASDMSSWLFMAYPMLIFSKGLSFAWVAIGLISGMWVNWHFVAPRLRRITEEQGSFTLSSFFESSVGDQGGKIRVLAAALSVLFLTHYLSAGLISMGLLFESLFHLNYYAGISIASAVVLAYTMYGGFVTVAWTDFFQGVFLLLMIVMVPLFATVTVGGFDTVIDAARIKHTYLSIFSDSIFENVEPILMGLAWGIGYLGMPHVLTKFMGIRDSNEMYKSKYVGITWQILALLAATFVGLSGISLFPEGLVNDELIFVEMVQSLFPTFIVGFILCGVIAATISTMDSQILVVSSVLSEDFYKKSWNKEASSEDELRFTRMAVLGVTLLALSIALKRDTSIADKVLYSWTGLGSSFGPLVLACLFCKRITSTAAISGMLVGSGMAMIWPHIEYIGSVNVPSMIVAFSCGLITILALSALTKRQVEDTKKPS